MFECLAATPHVDTLHMCALVKMCALSHVCVPHVCVSRVFACCVSLVTRFWVDRASVKYAGEVFKCRRDTCTGDTEKRYSNGSRHMLGYGNRRSRRRGLLDHDDDEIDCWDAAACVAPPPIKKIKKINNNTNASYHNSIIVP